MWYDSFVRKFEMWILIDFEKSLLYFILHDTVF